MDFCMITYKLRGGGFIGPMIHVQNDIIFVLFKFYRFCECILNKNFTPTILLVCLFPRNFRFGWKCKKFIFCLNSKSLDYLESFHQRICLYLKTSYICDYLNFSPKCFLEKKLHFLKQMELLWIFYNFWKFEIDFHTYVSHYDFKLKGGRILKGRYLELLPPPLWLNFEMV